MLAPEGTRPLLAAAVAAAVLVGAGFALDGRGVVLVALGSLLPAAALWAVRDPRRTPPPDADRVLLAPVDGTVVEIAEAFEPRFLQRAARRVAIVPSVLDVHVHRAPATGTVAFAEAVAGPRPSWWTGLRHDLGVPVLVEHQGRGGSDVAVGTRLSAGQRLGLAPRGVRVAVAVPIHIALDVEVGQKTVAGETVIGRLSSSPGGDGVGRRTEAPILEAA